ncbi:NB-ARC domain-containing protein [Nocardia sp. NPDC058176]|uniref:NB-ARC domain-containing protein n=1 Tax=Nocardia sp. NPDC058176 TaxID=3346368 RepID=UPI0036D92941
MVSNSELPERVPLFVNHTRLMKKVTERVLTGGPGNRTVVLSGEPGIGKTAFGVELAYRMRPYYADGELYVPFGGTEQPDHPDDVLGFALRALGEPVENIPDRRGARRARYRALTRDRSLMVFLDGVVTEQQVRALLPGEGSSLVVVTEARPAAPVDATGMELFVVESLDDNAARQLLESLIGHERCAAEPEAAAALIALCGHLPQALRIVASMAYRAAARSTSPLADTVERLRDDTRRRTALPLERVYGAAYRSLPERTRRCYRALGLPAHGGRVGADALAAALEWPVGEVAELLIDLADTHLLKPVGADRYQVRELVRRHAAEVDDRPAAERDAEQWRLVAFYDRQIAAADGLIAPGRPWRTLLLSENDTTSALFATAEQARAWLRQERSAILAAAAFADAAGDEHYPQRWAVLLWAFHEKEKILDDLRLLHGWGLVAAGRAGQPDVVSLLHIQRGFAHLWAGDHELAAEDFAAGAAAATRMDLEASALEGLGLTRFEQGRTYEALDLLRRNAELADQIGDQRRILIAALHLAKVESPETALALLDTAATGFAAAPTAEADNLAKAKYWRGRTLASIGDYDTAADELAAAHAVMTTLRRYFDLAEIEVASAQVEQARGMNAAAREFLAQAITHYERVGHLAAAQRTRAQLAALPGR